LIAAILAGAGAGLGMSLAAGPAYGAESWNHPFANRKTPSRKWGFKPDGTKWPEYNDGFHKGIDYDWGGGTQIHAVAAGTVVAAGWNAYGQSWAGNAVLIRHASGWHSYYAHMSAFDVTQGQHIAAGGRVGRVGTTGQSDGNHLHLEIWRTGSRSDRTDPYPLVHDAPFPGQAPAPTPTPQLPIEEDDMLALRIQNGSSEYLAAIGPGIFRHFIPTDPYEKIKNLLRIQDDWQSVNLSELSALLRTFGCDLDIWDVRNGQFVVLDPLTGTVAPGNVWTASGAIRAAIAAV
jgi:murein DD-endopeptidase MepM/ murein hydrolase activator NlpD